MSYNCDFFHIKYMTEKIKNWKSSTIKGYIAKISFSNFLFVFVVGLISKSKPLN